MNKLHIYAQYSWHEEAWIAGDRESLTKLRDALTRVLDNKEPTCIHTEAADGEGYTTFIVRIDDPKVWETLELPYIAWHGKQSDESNKFTHPSNELSREQYVKMMKDAKI